MIAGIANAPCSWGVEFAEDARNPAWARVLDECAASGYRGIELGPVGFMPEDPAVLADALAQRDLTLVAGVVFRPFHDPGVWEEVLNASRRTCAALAAHGAKYLVLIDSISPRRAPTAGRAGEAEQMAPAEWAGLVERIRSVARMGREDYGLTPCIHAHAAGFIDFEPELERLLQEIDAQTLHLSGYRTSFLCRLRSGGFHASAHGPDLLYPLQGYRSGDQGLGGRVARRFLRSLRQGDLLQSRQG